MKIFEQPQRTEMASKYKIGKIGKIAIPVFFIFFSLVIAGALDVAAASTIVVNGTCVKGDLSSDTIQEAIWMAEEGDTIVVCPGTYKKNIKVGYLSNSSKDIIKNNIANSNSSVNTTGNALKTNASSSSNIIYVPDDYKTIQGAINAASLGDIIIVRDGTYTENVKVNKRLTIQSENGSDSTIVQSATSGICDRVFEIAADHVTISGFTIKGAAGTFAAGVHVVSHFVGEGGHCIIENNIISDNYYAIEIIFADNNTISNNLINGNCISLLSSESNIVSNNELNGSCISLHDSSNNLISGNVISGEAWYDGIKVSFSPSNIISDNIIKNSKIGIALFHSNNNTIEKNIISNNKLHGIYLYFSLNNYIKGNIANLNRWYGIHLDSSNNNYITGNTASNNINPGIFLNFSNNNIIKYNNISNTFFGILICSSSNNIVAKNIANSNKCGIFLKDLSSANIIKNNFLNLNTVSAIWLDSSTTNNIIAENIAKSNHIGIYLSSSSNNTIKNNMILNNDHFGIYLSSSSKNVIIENIVNLQETGINLESSSNNVITGNIANLNRIGILLGSSDNNNVKKNIANLNIYWGIRLEDSSYNDLEENIVSRNDCGISLSNSTKNTIYHNNIIDNREDQARDDNLAKNNWNHSIFEEGNYWSDYKGVDDGSGRGKHAISGDGIGDTEIPHPNFGYDQYPFMNKSGWLTLLVSPEYREFGTVYQGDIKPKQTFEIQNRGKNNLIIFNITSDEDVEITGIEFPTIIPAGTSKTFNVTIDTKNLKGDILRSIEIISNDKITPNKMILMYGFVKVYTPDVRVEKTDFESRVIKGQINLFQISVNNTGVANETNVTVNFTDGDTVLSKEIPELKKNETKTVKFKWDTANASLGIHEIKIEVISGKGELLDRLKLKVYVLPTTKASTFIVTNLKRMAEKWGNDNITELEEKLIELSFHPSVNGIVVRVENETNCSKIYEEWDRDKEPEKANEIAEAIKSLIDSKLGNYSNIEYLIIVGDDRIIPYYRILDNTSEPSVAGWYTEKNYSKLNRDSTVGSALHNNMFLTDNFYASVPMEWSSGEVYIPELFIPEIPISRLVETPEEISTTIKAFYQKEYTSPDKIFVTGYDFMGDSALYCGSLLKEEMKREPKIMVNVTPNVSAYSKNVMKELLNTSNNIILVFQHADHNQFYILEINVTSQNISTSPADLNGSIVCSLGCHSGLNVPINSSDNDFDLAQAFAQKGVLAYIAPTGYSIGSGWIRAGHELLISYFTKHLCEGMDVGTALMLAKQEYWANNYDFNYIDEKVLGTTILYGIPMVRVPQSATSYNESEAEIKSMNVGQKTTEKPDTIVIRPTHSLKKTKYGNYYITPSGELLSDPRKPVQPQEIRIFHPTPERMLHGAVMIGAKYKDEPFSPLIEYYKQSPEQKAEPVEIELENWYPDPVFKINTIRYHRAPMEARQYLIIVTGQYKGGIWYGTERLYDEISFDLYYASPDNETPPTIENVSLTNINDNVSITVNASDKSGIQRVLVTYTDGKGEWKSEDLNKIGVLWSCEIPIDEVSEFFVQAVDNNGNAAVGKQWRIPP